VVGDKIICNQVIRMQIYYYYKYKCKDGKKKRGMKGLNGLTGLTGLKGFLFLVSSFRLEGFEGCSEAEGCKVPVKSFGFGPWKLEFGPWNCALEFGIWILGLGIWILGLGTWNLDLGTWNLVFWNLTTPS
jgi:hypothetical protein